jgi:hypothetical protein
VAAVRVESEGAVGLTVQREPRGRRVRNRTDYDIIPLFFSCRMCHAEAAGRECILVAHTCACQNPPKVKANQLTGPRDRRVHSC